MHGAGHLAFSDICTLGLGAFYDTYLADRDDLQPQFASTLRQFAVDGCQDGEPVVESPDCPTSFLPIATSDAVVRHYATVFFDEHLYGTGTGVADGLYTEATLQ